MCIISINYFYLMIRTIVLHYVNVYLNITNIAVHNRRYFNIQY